MNRLKSLLASGSASGNMLKLGGGTALGQVFSVLALPVVSRLYDPIQRGVFSLFVSFITVATVCVGLRYEYAIPSAKTDEEANELLSLTLLAVGGVSFVSAAVLAFLIMAGVGGYDQLGLWAIPASLVVLLTTGAFASLRFWMVRQGKFGQISRAMVQQGAARALIPIILGWMQFGWIGLAIGEAGGRMFGVRSLLSGAKGAINLRLNPTKMEVAKRHREMPVKMLPSSLLDSFGASLATPMIFSLYGPKESGLFAFAIQIIGIPSGLIAASVADVFHQEFAELIRTNPDAAMHRFKHVAMKIGRIALAIYVPVGLLCPILASPVLGPKWADLGWILPALIPLTLGAVIASPLSRILVVLERIDLKLCYDILNLFCVASTVYFCATTQKTFGEMIGVYSLTQVCAFGIYIYLIYYAIKRWQPCS